ncbi:Na+/H+ antiporter NhaA [Thalassotalea maritima]|uniref:Na+/H+ antiporter NhaA n=1 Tax=Thalassotalea maritima TaxID=3242416 RepID=UPI003529865D
MRTLNSTRKFFTIESLSGILLLIMAVLAMLIKNTGGAEAYNALLFAEIEIRAEAFSINKPLLLWINDGIMAIFFFVVGLELKKELLVGKLSDRRTLMLPVVGALGGVLVPALIYLSLNWGNTLSAHGWAIPTATDIAFALAVLSILGNRVPTSLKLFLMTLAILDDLAGIIIIAFFYTDSISWLSLLLASIGYLILFTFNRTGVNRIAPYLLVGIFIWICFLKSGVHATIAGVVNAFFIPLTLSKAGKTDHKNGLLSQLLHNLHPYVAIGVLPLFAFANAGVQLDTTNLSNLFTSVPAGIVLGLFIGKQLGVFSFSFIAIKLKLCQLPQGSNWGQLYGTSVLCGIGFTMSLFIASLAFAHGGAGEARIDRLAIILGSILSALWGVIVLYLSSRPQKSSIE